VIRLSEVARLMNRAEKNSLGEEGDNESPVGGQEGRTGRAVKPYPALSLGFSGPVYFRRRGEKKKEYRRGDLLEARRNALSEKARRRYSNPRRGYAPHDVPNT